MGILCDTIDLKLGRKVGEKSFSRQKKKQKKQKTSHKRVCMWICEFRARFIKAGEKMKKETNENSAPGKLLP